MSPPHRKRHDSLDMSPPRRKRHDSPDLCPSRKSRLLPGSQSGTDLSPPRKKTRRPGETEGKTEGLGKGREGWKRGGEGQRKDARVQKETSNRGSLSPTHMSSGTKAGLQDAETLRRENAAAHAREQELYRSMDPSESGRGAETVYRDKMGRKINPKLERLKQKEEEKKKLEEEEKFMQWGRG